MNPIMVIRMKSIGPKHTDIVPETIKLALHAPVFNSNCGGKALEEEGARSTNVRVGTRGGKLSLHRVKLSRIVGCRICKDEYHTGTLIGSISGNLLYFS